MHLARALRPPTFLVSIGIADAIFLLGAAVFVLPTGIRIAQHSWTTEQGGHGPIVLAIGIWLLWRELKISKAARKPGNPVLGGIFLIPLLLTYVVANITGVLEIEALAMYGALIAGAYLLVGWPVIKSLWFPILYLALALPPPDTVVAAVTQPIKIAISEWAVAVLHAAGYPIASSGVVIQIAQFELLVAAACAGLNSILTLSAICLFYGYIRHRTNPYAFAVIAAAVIPIAVFANFVRVLLLILITYHLGESAAQGFLHDFAGLTMFAAALLGIFVVDAIYTKFAGLNAALPEERKPASP